jgi:hypothetical protein
MSADIEVRCYECNEQIGSADDRSDVLTIRDEHSDEMDDDSHKGDWWLDINNPRPV